MEKARTTGELALEERTELDTIVDLTNLNIAVRGHALVQLKARGENIDYFLKRKLG
jgi:hypothetical protein